ncbi:MAG TPA: serine hydrolase [Dehalococcoidia bacterium]|nr:serine hydrolase [Dehalococcoidia bacterium]
MTDRLRRGYDGFIQPPTPDRSGHRAGRALAPTARAAALRPVPSARGATLPRQPREGPRSLPLRVYLLLAITFGAAVLGVRALGHHSRGDGGGSAAQPAPAQAAAAPSLWVDPDTVQRYQSQLTSLLAGRGGKYGFVALDLTTGVALLHDPDTQYRAASVNKLPIVIDLYRRAAAGQINLDATTAIADDEIQHYGTGTIQSQGSGQVYSYRDLARLAIEESDNTAAFVLGKRLGLDSVQHDLESWGLKATSLADNLTTARDAAVLLSLLAQQKLLPAAATQELLTLMQNTVWTDRLQSGVPATVRVAHKIGTDVDVFNDAAIFLAPNHPYIAVALGAGVGEDDGNDTMSALSKLTYQFEAALPAATHVTHH